MSAFVVSNIKPSLKVDANQRFIFGLDEFPEPLGSFKLDNIFTPVVGTPSVTNFETRNKDLSGFRWIHTTNAGDTFGSYKLQSFVNAQNTGTDILLFNQDGTVTFNQPVSFPGFAITGDLDMNSHKIINLADPVNAQDATTKTYVDSKTWTTSVITDFTSATNLLISNATIAIAKLSGFPNTNTTYLRGDGTWANFNNAATVLRLDQFSVPTASINFNNQKIINLAIPTLGTDGTNKTYVDSKTWTTAQITDYTTATNSLIAAATIATSKLSGFPNTTTTYLRGDGTWVNFATAATTAALTLRLDQFALPTASVNLNNQKIINLATPTLATDAVTKGYVDNLAANLPSLVNVTGASQTFLYSSNYNSSFVIKNSTVPISGNNSTIDLRLSNSINGGYRLRHNLTSGALFGGLGQLSLDAVSSFGDIVNFINFDFSSVFGGAGFAGGVPNTTFGTITADTLVATLSVNGGPQNVTNESSCFRVVSSDNSTKIELKNTSASGRLYELRSNSDSSFGILDRTLNLSRYIIDSSGDTQTFNYSNSLSNSILSILNTNSNAVTRVRAGTSTNSVELGYDGSNGYSYINWSQFSNDRLAFRVNGTGIAAFLSTGLFGFGTITPTLAKVQINGGVQNVTGEETAIRAIGALSNIKIELQNTSASGKVYELRSSSTGIFDIYDRTGNANRLTIGSTGNVGIGTTPNSFFQIANQAGQRRVFTLYELANNQHQFLGFGTISNPPGLVYQVAATTDNHTFFAATSATTSNELCRITGTGDLVVAGTIYGRRVSGLMSMQGNGVGTSIPTLGNFFKVEGTTTASNLNGLTSPVSNRLTVSSTIAHTALINVAFTALHNGAGGDEMWFALYKNGLRLANTVISTQGANNTRMSHSIATLVNMTTNDYIELWCSHSNNGRIVTVTNLMFTYITT